MFKFISAGKGLSILQIQVGAQLKQDFKPARYLPTRAEDRVKLVWGQILIIIYKGLVTNGLNSWNGCNNQTPQNTPL